MPGRKDGGGGGGSSGAAMGGWMGVGRLCMLHLDGKREGEGGATEDQTLIGTQGQ